MHSAEHFQTKTSDESSSAMVSSPVTPHKKINMFHRRRLNALQYVLLGVLFGSSVYLWTKRASINERFETVNLIETSTAKQFMEEQDNNIQPMADPLSIDPSVNSCGDVTEVSPKEPVGIEPFPKFELDAVAKDDLNRTLYLLDLWNNDTNCLKHEVYLLKPESQVKPGALVSFPGSGNSWLRMLLMGTTGIFATSVYDGEDGLFVSKANGNTTYPLPIDCRCTLLQKTHDFSLDASLYNLPEANKTHTLEKYNNKGIFIIRNPFRAIPSYRNFEYTGLMGAAPKSAFEGESWDNFVSRSIASWETLATVWIRGLKQGGIIYYERLRHETESELKRLVTMLGLSYEKERLSCVLRHTNDNTFKRETPKTPIENPFTPSQRLLIHKAIDSVQLVLKERGLDPLPIKYYDFFDIIPEYGLRI